MIKKTGKKTNKMTLEQRIAKLELLVNKVKNEEAKGISPDKFDAMCSKFSEREMDSKASIKRTLGELEKLVAQNGGKLRFGHTDGMYTYSKQDIDLNTLLSMIEFEDNEYLSIDFVDGDAGDKYALVFHNFDDPDDEEFCASLIGDFE